jgi:hypothetical protein
MVTAKKAIARHPRTILKCYKMFLEGSSDDEIENVGISAADIRKCKHFHQCMLENKTFYKTGMSLAIPEHLSKRMFEMFSNWKNGEEIAYRGNITNVISAYAMLLEGADQDEMLEAGCTELEIEKAKLFTRYVNADMVVASICKETQLVASTVKRLKKMYRENMENQNQSGSPDLYAMETA